MPIKHNHQPVDLPLNVGLAVLGARQLHPHSFPATASATSRLVLLPPRS